jgi:hypothetical protein
MRPRIRQLVPNLAEPVSQLIPFRRHAPARGDANHKARQRPKGPGSLGLAFSNAHAGACTSSASADASADQAPISRR